MFKGILHHWKNGFQYNLAAYSVDFKKEKRKNVIHWACFRPKPLPPVIHLPESNTTLLY